MSVQFMTPQEIHAFGVTVAVEQVSAKGHVIVEVHHEFGGNPQIVTRYRKRLNFIVVRTGVYPGVGQLPPHEHAVLCAFARQHKGLPAFVSMGIANADATDEAGKGLPIRGAQYRVHCGGLLLVMDDNVRHELADRGAAPAVH